ncbi:transcription initiation factor TFIID subunit 11-like [Sturnira hondurensis]|uniref:transcription initiation factor TFIID subunit 11-like n=1 Tax=Sturnira hondurensis TaxID=192404 RepID=UPI00187A4D3F|nr:transcription initiation factor TFIID subunit 11-like [Sturnira hondurensis]
MNEAGPSPSSKAEDTGGCSRRAVARQGPGPSHTRRIPAHRLEEPQKASDRDGGVRSQDDSDPRAGARKGSPSSPPAAKRLKRDTTEKERKREAEEEDAQKMKLLMSSLSEEQQSRYEVYRSSAFPRATVKGLIQKASGGTSVPSNVVTAVAGLAKVFVGEVVEEALDVCERWGETPPLQPKHLREAVRRLSSKGKVPNIKPRNVLF